MAVGFVVVSHCHWRIERERVHIMPQYALNGYHNLSPLPVPPILADFDCLIFRLTTFLHAHYYQEHTQHLVCSAGSEDCEVLLLFQLAPVGFFNLQPCPTMGAGASLGRFFHYPTMSAVHTRSMTFGQSVGKVADALMECPLALRLGNGAQMLAFSKHSLFKSVSRFNTLSSLLYSLRNT